MTAILRGQISTGAVHSIPCGPTASLDRIPDGMLTLYTDDAAPFDDEG